MTDWCIRGDANRDHFIAAMREREYPYMARLSEYKAPKTTQQVRYANYLCGVWGKAHNVGQEDAKYDCKLQYGVWEHRLNSVDGSKVIKVESFRKYSREAMTAFLTSMEALLDRHEITYIPSESDA